MGFDVETYNQHHLRSSKITDGSSDRLWWFQVCTEVAYFQVAPANDSIRSSKVDERHISFLYSESAKKFKCYWYPLFNNTMINGLKYLLMTDTIWTSAKMSLGMISLLM